MDWRRLVQFALLGSIDLEPFAILLVRVSLGLFFAISGANKLIVAGSRQTMYETLVKAKVPVPRLMTYFVSGVEFVSGSLLTVGFLSSMAGVALLIDMLVAILTTKLSAMPKGCRLLTGSTTSCTFRRSSMDSSLSGWSAPVRESSVSITGSPAS